ncbi:tRNA (adenosine(37)-N6)-threonylcarbamoyltransferase complex ATPase subunit type 1 TsaE [Cellulomonas carbonis]|uniref:tRNA threonylcarbamoyladenosine biosynthesis protein TsaE n=1 Tax=Cellulomonas carbonis T26 TaxID=947969 RepID=A0A0A0BN58_9CELL|nr:tRNA (adenosine(37)-N6)-threonylcarbamoyltransferase complex ATPase subunit type 1 TsaE [Cellulomonas carbonis]KGM09938.1 ATPase [Cellulomonas carbonis T26]GGC10239.1 tRNA threonylcarbamoyladenosine biosynthesis protein TsaE [Cellulomonas carbonis]
MTSVRVDLLDADATRAYARGLAGLLRAGDLVVLTGPLGAGKTTFAQGVGEGLGVRGQVSSPTFVIARVHPSTTGGPALVHVDAYRLGSLDELDALDLDESLEDSVTLVEWGAGLAEVLSEDRLEVTIERPHGEMPLGGGAGGADLEQADVGVRHVTLRGVGARWDGVPLPVVPSA